VSYEFHFQREGIIDINAAVIGISRNRWTSIPPENAFGGQAQKIMKENGFDVLPIDDGKNVRRYFNTHAWGTYTLITQQTITYRDVISYQTSVRDLVKGFAGDKRNFYFLGAENRIVGLVTIANLNCRQMQTYLFSLFCELETQIAAYLSARMSQDEIRTNFSQSTSSNVPKVEARFNSDSRKGVDAPYVEYLYFSDLIQLIASQQWHQLGISHTRQAVLKELKDWRNRVAHPTKSLIRNPDEVAVLWDALDLIEEILFQIRHG